MILRYHDEKLYNFWGGLYEVTDPNDDDAPAPEIAAICEHPEAHKLAVLFCASPKLLETAKLALDVLDFVAEGQGAHCASRAEQVVAKLRQVIALAEEGENAISPTQGA